MNHGVTVAAERYEVVDGVNHVFALKGVVGLDMVYFYISFTNLAVCLLEVKATANAVDMASP